jgi:hypothetical protein
MTQFWLSVVLLGIGFVSAYTGTVLFFFPHGGGLGRLALTSPFALGLARDELRVIHAWSGFALVALVVAHLILNWRWILAMLGFRPGRRVR